MAATARYGLHWRLRRLAVAPAATQPAARQPRAAGACLSLTASTPPLMTPAPNLPWTLPLTLQTFLLACEPLGQLLGCRHGHDLHP